MKLFSEVFDLNLTDEQKNKVQNLYVEKLIRNNNCSNLHISFFSKEYFDYKLINDLLVIIKSTYFNKKRINIDYSMRNSLQDKSFIDAFDYQKEFIKDEIKHISPVFSNIFKDSTFQIIQTSDDNSFEIILSVPSYVLYKQNITSFCKFIQDFLSYRFSINLKVNHIFVDVENKSFTKEEIFKYTEKLRQENLSSFSSVHLSNMSPTHTLVDRNNIIKRRASNLSKTKFHEEGNLIYGNRAVSKTIPIYTINNIDAQINNLVVNACITDVEYKITKTGKFLIKLILSDKYDSVVLVMWAQNEKEYEIAKKRLCKGLCIKIEASAWADNYSKEIALQNPVSIESIPKEIIFPIKYDNSNEKRVELHLHTKMSAQDGVGEVEDYINTALNYGMKAMAITDHGVVHTFAKANSYLNKKKKENEQFKDFKLIYGVEGYLVDDENFDIPEKRFNYNIENEYVVFDIETTGLHKYKDSIIEIGAVLIKNGELIKTFSEFVNPGIHISNRITELTSITDSDVKNADEISKVLQRFKDFVGNRILVGHNVNFDYDFIVSKGKLSNISFSENKTIDTMQMMKVLFPNEKNSKLDTLSKLLHVVNEHHHRAIDDAICTAKCFIKLLEINNEKLDTINKDEIYHNLINKSGYNHIILLAKNDVGRVNLYKIISYSHTDYFYKKPRIPRSLINKYREGLIIGSACCEGEIFKAVYNMEDDSVIDKLALFYDYFEIQPIENNKFLIDDEKSYISNEQDLIDINTKIVELADKYNKPCVATCDCHFVNSEDVLYRDILMFSLHHDNVKIKEQIEENKNSENKFNVEEHDANSTKIKGEGVPLYFRNTEEMLDCFKYLPEEKRKEIVIDNTNLIASWIENISPVREDKCTPYLNNCENELKDYCINNLHKIYGDNPPEIVKKRLDVELNSIINNGYSVLYMAAKKLIDESLRNGYSVGSRGSVGSSFVANICGISEVNPLPPHYICPNCHYSDFDSDTIKQYQTETGYDLPNKTCPMCGAELKKDGANIPFETFLGFDGDKEPDIDLNFSKTFQKEAQLYTNVLFGEKFSYFAGTISTLKEKQCAKMIKDYFAYKNIRKRNSHINYISSKIQGIKKTTGQHPGGVIVLPNDESIFTFTPLNFPANKRTESNKCTTHFEYHDIDKNLLKLDMLAQGGPETIRKLYDLTGIDPIHVDISDPKILELFKSLNSLDIHPEDIGGVNLGILTIPEFGTPTAIKMVNDAKPQSISDLIRISGLAHGTGVWEGNAKELIQNNNIPLKDTICCRDDIMIYLIKNGIEPKISFKIMEAVRKGKKLTPEWEELLKSKNIPEWYIKSCNTIEYMFPKAHAAAYVMSALRIAYFKVYYPAEYYAAYFSINIDNFDYDLMCTDYNEVSKTIKKYSNDIEVVNTIEQLSDKLDNRNQNDDDIDSDASISKKTVDKLFILQAIREMFARGISFAPIDLYKSKAEDFIVFDKKIVPPFRAIPGLGAKVAKLLADEAEIKPFENIEDFQERTGIKNKSYEKLEELGLFIDLKHKEVEKQISIFDL